MIRVAAALAALVSLAAPAAAFNTIRTQGGRNLTWAASNIPVPWVTDTAASDDLSLDSVRSGIGLSFDAWGNLACSSMRFRDNGTTTVALTAVGSIPPDNKNVMKFQESNWPARWNGAIAITQPVHDPSSGRIFDADILFNGDDFRWSNADQGVSGRMDLRNIATHEIGHFQGLDHPGTSGRADDPARPEATMFATSPVAETKKRTLSLDDILGACTLYRRAGQTGAPCGVDGDCLGGTCATDAATGARFCSKACAAPADCGTAPFGCSGGRCLVVEAGSSIGDPCASGTDCRNPLICLGREGAAGAVCTQRCAAPGECPPGWGCVRTSGGFSACFKVEGGLPIGTPCNDENSGCDAGLSCTPFDATTRLCSRGCGSEPCPPDFTCSPALSGARACRPASLTNGTNGQRCTADAECASGLCLAADPARCAKPCTEAAVCAAGETCVQAGGRGGCLAPAGTPGTAVISALTADPVSPAIVPVTVRLTCRGTAPNGVSYRFYVQSKASPNWFPLTDWQDPGTYDWRIEEPESFFAICRARDKQSGANFDAERSLVFEAVRAPAPGGDGDIERVEVDRGGSAATGGGGCAHGGVSWAWAAGVVWFIGRAARRRGAGGRELPR